MSLYPATQIYTQSSALGCKDARKMEGPSGQALKLWTIVQSTFRPTTFSSGGRESSGGVRRTKML